MDAGAVGRGAIRQERSLRGAMVCAHAMPCMQEDSDTTRGVHYGAAH